MFFHRAAIITLFSSLAQALPQESTCTVSYSTSTYDITTVIPTILYSTSYVNSTSTVEGVQTSTVTYLDYTTITTSSTSCVTTSYPVTYWVTTEYDTVVEGSVVESCTETSVTTIPTCSTIVTAVPVVSSCTEYTTECIPTSTSIPYTTCVPCDPPTFTGY